MPWLTTLLMVTGIAILAGMYWIQHVTVQKAEVKGVYFTSAEEVLKTADVTMGVHPDSLDLNSISERIERLDYVRSVSPYVEPNGNLQINVSERYPMAMLVNGEDRSYVDAEGVRLPILDGKTLDLPLIYGFSAVSKDTIKDESFLQIRDFLMRAKADEFGWITVSEVVFDPADGVVALSHENGVKLIFGRNDFKTKLENWKAFYAEIVRTKGIESMQQVDLRFTNQVVTREI